ncbi:MAG: hypothetical protein F4210_17745, partial [Holophagales bacterium]|nr:hypothetical protein [Holophagales bacterium]
DSGGSRTAGSGPGAAVDTGIAACGAYAEPESTERRGDLAAEVADLAYHVLVLLQATGVELADVAAELGRRHQEAGRVPS